MHTVYLGLGSSLGKREEHLKSAVERLRGLGRIECSSVYESAPLPPAREGDPAFFNVVVKLETPHELGKLIEACEVIERELGKPAGKPKEAPRTIDIDFLLFNGEAQVRHGGYVIPHERMHERKFVLTPLAELAPQMILGGKSVSLLLKTLKGQRVRKIGRL